MQIQLPEKVEKIIHTLEAAGYEAYAVGGCVRDSLLGRTPEDWDITTSAKPHQVKGLFRRTVDTGIAHGTVTVMLDKEGFEVTTYRIDGKYEDSRHPKDVTFTASLEEDLKRRDFTINAMAYNDREGMIDLFHGTEDLQQGIIRCVGDPIRRFGEDALRMMRAVRFSAQLGFWIEDQTFEAVRTLADTIGRISAERVQTELLKLICSPHPEHLKRLYDTGVTKYIFPELDVCMETGQNNPHHCYTVGEHTLCALRATPPDKVLRLAILFHDMGKPQTKTTDEQGIDHFHGHPAVSESIARTVMRRLKFDTDTLTRTAKLVLYHDRRIEETPLGMRRAMNRMGMEVFPAIFEIKQADIAAQSDFQRAEKLEHLDRLRVLYEEEVRRQSCVSLKTLAVKGRDLMELGFAPGPELGLILQSLLEHVVEEPGDNTRERLLILAEEKRTGAQK